MLLGGCSPVGQKEFSVVPIYAIAALASLLLLICCCAMMRKRDPWYLLLFSSVLLVNIGYLALSIAKTLGEALLANRISYLGSVFLPFSMLMIILEVCAFKQRRWLTICLSILSVLVFLLAASPGYSTLYYQEVSLQIKNGVTTLQKIYGPLHRVYLFYLAGYFFSMLAAIIYSGIKGRMTSKAMTVFLFASVFINIGIWLLEQLVYIEFELLSLSYIMCELFLLGAHMMLQEAGKHPSPEAAPPEVPEASPQEPQCSCEQLEQFLAGRESLTKTERTIYRCYTEGLSTKEITEQLGITENTLKFHNKNLYSKLGVGSRKELRQLHRLTRKDETE